MTTYPIRCMACGCQAEITAENLAKTAGVLNCPSCGKDEFDLDQSRMATKTADYDPVERMYPEYGEEIDYGYDPNDPSNNKDTSEYDICPNCGGDFWLGAATCGKCGKSPVGPDGRWGKSGSKTAGPRPGGTPVMLDDGEGTNLIWVSGMGESPDWNGTRPPGSYWSTPKTRVRANDRDDAIAKFERHWTEQGWSRVKGHDTHNIGEYERVMSRGAPFDRSAAIALDIARHNPDLPNETIERLAAKVAARLS